MTGPKLLFYWGIILLYGMVSAKSVLARFKVEISEVPLTFRDRYIGAKACQKCHQDIYEQWKTSIHSKAYINLTAQDQQEPTCLRCHTTGYGSAGGFSKQWLDLAGVQCEACHGPYGSHPENPGFKRPLATDTDNNNDCQNCNIRKQCMVCHTQKHSPQFNFDKYYSRVKHKP